MTRGTFSRRTMMHGRKQGWGSKPSDTNTRVGFKPTLFLSVYYGYMVGFKPTLFLSVYYGYMVGFKPTLFLSVYAYSPVYRLFF